MQPTPPSSSRAPSMRRRRTPVVEQYDDSSSEEQDADENSAKDSSSEGDDSDEDASDDSDDQHPQSKPPPRSTPVNNNLDRSKTANTANTSSRRRPPPQPLNTKSDAYALTPTYNARTTSRAKVRNQRPSNTSGASGSSVPSYEDNSTGGLLTPSPSYFPPNNYKFLPTPPSTRQKPQHQQQQEHWASQLSPPLPKPSVRTRRPHRPRTNTLPPNMDQNAGYTSSSTASSASSSSSSSSGPWQPMVAQPVPLKRSKTVREPVGAPVQAIVPRAPRTVAAARIDEENEDEEDDHGVEELERVVPPMMEPVAQVPKSVAGGKKAALAVELKMNLEIELELKAYIHGDVTLELFN